jgi:hypothetical protein
MTLRIGFIDHNIDEFHANHYPKYIADAAMGKEFQITLAWDRVTLPGTRSLEQWCKEMNIAKASSIEQVVAECDCIVVLSPNNGEFHEELSQVALRSGKPVYVDKPFAMDLPSAQRMVDLARKHRTPLFSASALRFDSALVNAIQGPLAGKEINFIATRSLATFPVYGIHHLEILSLFLPHAQARRVMHTGTPLCSAVTVDYGNDRRAVCNTIPGQPWGVVAYHGTKVNERATVALDHTQITDFFPRFIDAMLTFFQTKQEPLDLAVTLRIAAVHEAAQKAFNTPDTWIDVPQV